MLHLVYNKPRLIAEELTVQVQGNTTCSWGIAEIPTTIFCSLKRCSHENWEEPVLDTAETTNNTLALHLKHPIQHGNTKAITRRCKGRLQPYRNRGRGSSERGDHSSPVSPGRDAAPGQCLWVSAAGHPPPLAENESSSFICHSPYFAATSQQSSLTCYL